MSEAYAAIEWNGPEGRRWVSKIENGRAFIRTEGTTLSHVLPESEITIEIRRDTANAASREKAEARFKDEQTIKERNLAAKKWLHGFTVGMSSIKARKIEETLDKQQGFSGRVMRRRDFIEQAVESGAHVVQMRGGRVLEMSSESFYVEKDVTKIALDYAEFLLGLIK